jgi:hypothetical protein
MMIPIRYFLLVSALLPALVVSAETPPKATKSKNASVKKRTYISGEAPSQVASKGGADTSEGWIIKRTKDGKIIKIPRKQTFKFGGSDVSGEASRPNETLLGSRLVPRDTTLIPERRTYRSEIMESVGYTERNRK